MNQPTTDQPLSIQQILKDTYTRFLKHKHIIQQMYEIQQKQILEPYEYLLGKGGKKIRVMMSILINDLYEKQIRPEVLQVGGLIQLLHSASLIIDDIQDNSIERRGQKCAHLVFGIAPSINAANLVYFLPFKKLLENFTDSQTKCKIMQIYMNEMISCHLGQGEDILVHKLKDKASLPTKKQYFRMTSAKTGSLLRMMVSMISVILDIDEQTQISLVECMNNVGISFQITDDILNVLNRVNKMGKGVIAEDLHEKKFTLIVHFLRDNQEFMDLFIIDKKDDYIIHKMLEIIDGSDTIQKCKQIAQQYAQKAIKAVDNIKCPFSKHNFKSLLKFIIERKN